MSLVPLPIDPHVDEIVRLVRDRRSLVITAAPGAGKTTRVPPALVDDGPVLLLQPRRVAARAIARRIAYERGWTLGREVGWHVRFDRHFSDDTRLLVATEGILTARLQQDALLAGFRTVVIDEFHERSIHADLGLALAREAWRARRDLRIVVMSATIDADRVAAYLNDCPVVDVPGRVFPLDITYRPGVDVERAVADLVPQSRGALLCFLPGAPEIRRAAERLAPLVDRGVRILPLHGGLDADEQDLAIEPSDRPRIVLATNIAETTLTVPDVTAVVDTGLHKVARWDPDRVVDSLDVERVSQDSADQRAGRAGRTQAGVVVRLWDARDRLRPHREPEIARVDLASTVMEVLAWGGDPRALAWFDPPAPSAIDAAFALLERLGAVGRDRRLTEDGRALRRLPLHPRLARLLLAAGAAPEAARACALLSERHFVPPRHSATSCDLLSAIEHERDLPPHIARVAREIRESARHVLGRDARDRIDEERFRRAVLAAYPDRVAARRAPRGDRFLLASGTGARLSRDSGVHDAEFIVAVEVTTSGGRPGAPQRATPQMQASAADEPFIRMATSIDREWLAPTSSETRHEFDAETGAVRAAQVDLYDAVPLSERSVRPDPEEASRIIAAAYIKRGPRDEDAAVLNRLAFAGIDLPFETLVRQASLGVTRIDDVRIGAHLADDVRRTIERQAPATLPLPNGRPVRLEYRSPDRVVAAVRLQAVIGLTETPRFGPKRIAVTFELLAPNGRPVQTTTDLASFWNRVYPEIRTALRARYPKHHWP